MAIPMTTVLNRSHKLVSFALLCLLAGCMEGLCDKPCVSTLTAWHHKPHVIPRDPSFGYRSTSWHSWQDGCMAGRAGPWPIEEPSATPASTEHRGDSQSLPTAPMPGEAIPAPPGEVPQNRSDAPRTLPAKPVPGDTTAAPGSDAEQVQPDTSESLPIAPMPDEIAAASVDEATQDQSQSPD